MSRHALVIISLVSIALVIATALLLADSETLNPQQTFFSIKDPSPVPWMLHGVVLDLGKKGDYDDKSVESPTIIKQPEVGYIMWYRGQTYADKTGRIMRATSPDGIHWTKTGVVMIPGEDYEGDKIDPMAVIYEDNLYKLWYGAEGSGGCACHATSPDGINWTRYQGNPVLRKTTGSWDNEGAGGQHTVIKAGNKYLMYYKGYGKSAPGWTFYGLAESTDGIKWAKKGKILSPDPRIGETIVVKNLYAFKVNDYYCLMFTMSEYLNLFLATSKNGKDWTKNGIVFFHGQTPGGYDEKWSTSPCVLPEADIIRMWYEGGDANGRVRTLYAEVYKDQFTKAFMNKVVPAPEN